MPHDYAGLLACAKEIIDGHNNSGGTLISYERFEQGLKDLGGTDVASIRQITWEDLESLGIPKLRARQIAEIFRRSDCDGEKLAPTFTADSVVDAADDDLVRAYDPKRMTGHAANELRRRSGDRPFVVFDESGGVHRKKTLEILRELLANYPPRDVCQINGVPTRLYRVGETPPELLDEHPLFPGEALYSDGKDQWGIAWGSLKLPVRQLLRYAVQTGELTVQTSDGMHDLFDRVLKEGDESVNHLRSRYQRAWIAFTEATAQSALPRLKIPASLARMSGRTQDPFHGGGHKKF